MCSDNLYHLVKWLSFLGTVNSLVTYPIVGTTSFLGTVNSLVTYPIVGTTYRGELPMQADMWIWIIVPKQ